jgi:hypothetical protein
MLRPGKIPRANAELYLVTITPHESIAPLLAPSATLLRTRRWRQGSCARTGPALVS